MIVRRGLLLSLAGVASGMVISVVLTRVISGLLFQVRPTDPLTLMATAALLLIVSAAASSLPACRAAGLDPTKTLRDQ